MKIKIGLLLLTILLLLTHLYTYRKGLVDGEQLYRHSKQFQMTLDAAYQYGLWDHCK